MEVDFGTLSNKGVILFLGAKESGKSTCINSIINYIEHKNLDEAINNTLIEAVPHKCDIIDLQNLDLHSVSIGPENESVRHTQNMQAYVYAINKATRISLIDSPGVNISNEFEENSKSNIEICTRILSYIGELAYNDSLRSICFVFSPKDNVPRILEFYVTNFLSKLDDSIAKNVTFIFTCSDGSNYDAAYIPECLQQACQAVKKLPPNLNLKLDGNVFFMDNEGLGFVAAIKKNLYYDASKKGGIAKNWEKSRLETYRLLSYIIGSKPLYPISMKNKKTTIEALNLIDHLAHPIIDTILCITENVDLLQIHRNELSSDTLTLDEIKSKMYVPAKDFQIVQTNNPQTICGDGCVQASNNTENICCNRCFLKNPLIELMGDGEIKNCEFIDQSTGICLKCKCSYNVHRHVYYLLSPYSDKIFDKEKLEYLNDMSLDEARNEAKLLIDKIDEIKGNLLEEQQEILKYIAKFAWFQKDCKIGNLHESFKFYMKYLIEQNNPASTKRQYLEETFKKYNEIFATYENFITVFMEKGLSNKQLFAKDEIFGAQNELYNLPWCGKKINDLYRKQFFSRKNEHDAFTKYINCNKIPFGATAKKEKNTTNAPEKTKKIQPKRPRHKKNQEQEELEMLAKSEGFTNVTELDGGVLKIEIIQGKDGTTVTNIENKTNKNASTINASNPTNQNESTPTPFCSNSVTYEAPPTYEQAVSQCFSTLSMESQHQVNRNRPANRGRGNARSQNYQRNRQQQNSSNPQQNQESQNRRGRGGHHINRGAHQNQNKKPQNPNQNQQPKNKQHNPNQNQQQYKNKQQNPNQNRSAEQNKNRTGQQNQNRKWPENRSEQQNVNKNQQNQQQHKNKQQNPNQNRSGEQKRQQSGPSNTNRNNNPVFKAGDLKSAMASVTSNMLQAMGEKQLQKKHSKSKQDCVIS